jgi:DNA primase
MPDGEDVDSLLQSKGAEGFEACMNEAPDGLTFCMNTLRAEHAPRDIMAWAKKFLSDLSDASLRAYYLPRITSGLGLSEADFRRDMGVSGPPRNTHRQPRQESNSQQQAIMAVGKEDKDDRYFLMFPIQYPDYVPALAERGFGHILGTDWARAFWEKLVNTQQGQVMSLLNEQEKSFYIKCREEMRQNILSGQELLNEWNHICKKITFGQQKMDRRQLKEALHQAQQSGDSQQVMKCLRALNESLRRDDEQY